MDDACGRPGRSEVGEHFGRECVVWVGRMAKVTYSFSMESLTVMLKKQ